MSGIYIHIPFCRTKCDYCNFFSLASQRHREAFADAICLEIGQRKDYLDDFQISTIYFGGGTPSLLPVTDIDRILNQIQTAFSISSDPEITLEANPDDLTKEKLVHYQKSGINRLSIGIQSFFPDDLHYLNRQHDSVQAHKAIEGSIQAGFSNLSIDLIFGIPIQNIKRLDANLKFINDYGIPHLSAYALTVEPNTALAWKTDKMKTEPVNDEVQADQFLFMMDWAETSGFLQYELSNYCKAGFESRHNSAYWKGEKYLGLGPSAHSFDGVSRQWNVSNLTKYLDGIRNENPAFEKEILSPTQFREEYVMTAIRTNRGIDIPAFEKRFGADETRYLMKKAKTFIQNGWLVNSSNHLVLSREGKLFADQITSALF